MGMYVGSGGEFTERLYSVRGPTTQDTPSQYGQCRGNYAELLSLSDRHSMLIS